MALLSLEKKSPEVKQRCRSLGILFCWQNKPLKHYTNIQFIQADLICLYFMDFYINKLAKYPKLHQKHDLVPCIPVDFGTSICYLLEFPFCSCQITLTSLFLTPSVPLENPLKTQSISIEYIISLHHSGLCFLNKSFTPAKQHYVQSVVTFSIFTLVAGYTSTGFALQ